MASKLQEAGFREPVEKRIAVKYRMWLRKHPKASKDEKLINFNRIADELYGN